MKIINHKFLTSYLYRIRTVAFLLTVLLSFFFSPACKKLVEVDSPVTSINSRNVYAADATAIAALTGIYIKMSQNMLNAGHLTSVSLFAGLSADEFTLYNGVTDQQLMDYYRNALTQNSSPTLWNSLFQVIFTANAAIEGLGNTTTLTPSVKQQLLGEAKFMRAFCYFYLINLYGKVPLIITTDYSTNALEGNSETDKLWQQVIADLNEAIGLLSDNYLDGTLLNVTSDRVRPTRWVAKSLLARVFLYTGDWINAELLSSEVIEHTSLYVLQDINHAFLKNSPEAIWQLQPVNREWNTEEGRLFNLSEFGPNPDIHPVFLSDILINSFEPGDLRKENWINKFTDTTLDPDFDYYYAFKYKRGRFGEELDEFASVFRLSEQYLIRAEACAKQDKLAESEADLNMIRERAGLPVKSGTTLPVLLSDILHEYQIEFFSEWGHRWLQLKRTDTIDAVMDQATPLKGGSWDSNWKLYPLPIHDVLRNPNLKQNPGY